MELRIQRNVIKRINLLFVFISLSLIGVLVSSCTTTQTASADPMVIDQIKLDVGFLADDKLEGRETGTQGEALAAFYISSRMRGMGVKPAGENGKYYQTFTFNPRNPHATSEAPKGQGIMGANVIGMIDNQADKTIVIGGHYDHLGYGEEGSLHAGEKAIHNGADDNASGIAGLLYLAKYLSDKNQGANYLFIAFSGEEKGLWGSSYFTKHPTIDLSTVSFMINMDMIGRYDASRGLAINGTGTSPSWEAVLDKAIPKDMKVIRSKSGTGPSDHTSFYYSDIPVLHFFTGQHSDYHKPSDDAALVNYEGIHEVVSIIANITDELNDEDQLEFTQTVDENERTAARFTVSLGVIPDYLYDGVGLRIDGVNDGKPAKAAGIMKGDIVVKMGDMDIDDIYAYMEGLSKYKEGDKVKIVVKRGEELIEKEVQF